MRRAPWLAGLVLLFVADVAWARPPFENTVRECLRKAANWLRIHTSTDRELGERIAARTRIQSPTDMVTDRALATYLGNQGDTFGPHLSALGPDDIWVDLGAGDAIATKQYRVLQDTGVKGMPAIEQRARVVAIGYHPPRPILGLDPHLTPDTYREIHGQFFEDIPETELASLRGQASLLTSEMGIASYVSATDFAPQLARMLELLKPGGHFHMRTSSANLSFVNASGHPLELAEQTAALRTFFSSIEGVKLTQLEVNPVNVKLVLERTGAPIKVPKLIPIEFEDGTPPGRTFRLPL